MWIVRVEIDGFSVPSPAEILAGKPEQYWRVIEQFEEMKEMGPRPLLIFHARWWGEGQLKRFEEGWVLDTEI